MRQFPYLRQKISRGLFIFAFFCGIHSVVTAENLLNSYPSEPMQKLISSNQAVYLGRMNPTEILQFGFYLPLRDEAGLDQFLEALYDPNSPSYRKYLTPAEFNERFGASQKDYEAVVDFAEKSGLILVPGTPRESRSVQVKSSIANIEKVFHLSMLRYKNLEENRDFFIPNRKPMVNLPFDVHISGLDNLNLAKPLHQKADAAAVSDTMNGSGPSGFFINKDFRKAYYGTGPLTGSGQTVGLVAFGGGYSVNNLNTYLSKTNQTNQVHIYSLSTDGTSTGLSNYYGDTEIIADITQVIGMAPGLANVVVYVGQSPLAIFSKMVISNPLPKTISCSWGWNYNSGEAQLETNYFNQMKAQGQSFFAASGDSATWTVNSFPSWPAESPDVITVGGTALSINADGSWLSESAWSGSGGGISPDKLPIPIWQSSPSISNTNNKASTSYRNGPDVSAHANTNIWIYASSSGQPAAAWVGGGTSFAAPMWAGWAALANQQAVNPLGFINPAIYQIGESVNYGSNFHDIHSGTAGIYSAVSGYDLVTGWGSMISGTSLMTALTPLYSISLSTMPANGIYGTVSANPKLPYYIPGSSVRLTASPKTGYQITNWMIDDVVSSSCGINLICTLSNITNNRKVSVTFNPVYTLTPSVNYALGGSISPATAISMPMGSNSVFTATAFTGYGVLRLIVDNLAVEKNLSSTATYLFSNINAAHNIQAVFKPRTYVLSASVSSNLGGSISPSQNIAYGQSSNTFTAKVNSGYQVQKWVLNSGDYSRCGQANTCIVDKADLGQSNLSNQSLQVVFQKTN